VEKNVKGIVIQINDSSGRLLIPTRKILGIQEKKSECTTKIFVAGLPGCFETDASYDAIIKALQIDAHAYAKNIPLEDIGA
jgi:hypothetical protein